MPLRRPAIERWPRKWSGRPVTLRLSPVPQTGGLAFFLRPADECVVCKMDAHPGLAPGSSVLRTDGSTTLPCARFENGEADGCRPRSAIFTGSNAGCYITASILKAILRPALPRHGLLYERSALLTSATEELKMALPRGLAPRSSAFARRHA